MNIRQVWDDFKDFERHELPWPIMMMIAFLVFVLLSVSIS